MKSLGNNCVTCVTPLSPFAKYLIQYFCKYTVGTFSPQKHATFFARNFINIFYKNSQNMFYKNNNKISYRIYRMTDEEYLINLMIEFASLNDHKGKLIPLTKSRESKALI